MRLFNALVIFCTVIMAEPARSQPALQYAEPGQVLLTVDSIPGDNNEKIVLSYKVPDGKLGADWVVVLLNSPYDQTRAVVRELVQNTFGIDSEREVTADVQKQKDVHPHKPKEPLFGDAFSDFHAIGIPIAQAHEYRIQSKSYKSVWSK